MESKIFKRLSSLALALAMVLAMIPASVFAVYADAECPHCGEAFTGTWTEVAADEWNAGGDVFTDGAHYRLTGKQTLTAELVLAEGKSVCIDLNGYAISAEGATSSKSFRTINNSGTMTVLDSSADETGIIEGGYIYSNSTTAVALAGGTIYNAGTFNLYGGTVQNGYVYYANSTGKSTIFGGNVYNAGIFNQYGGKITGGTVRGFAYTNHTNGGNIYCTTGSKLNLYGGEVVGGTATRSRWASPDYAIKGLNICSYGDVTIDGGKITGASYTGYTANGTNKNQNEQYIHGGNLYIEGAKLTVKSGEISDGNLTNNFTTNTTRAAATGYASGGNVCAVMRLWISPAVRSPVVLQAQQQR